MRDCLGVLSAMADIVPSLNSSAANGSMADEVGFFAAAIQRHALPLAISGSLRLSLCLAWRQLFLALQPGGMRCLWQYFWLASGASRQPATAAPVPGSQPAEEKLWHVKNQSNFSGSHKPVNASLAAANGTSAKLFG